MPNFNLKKFSGLGIIILLFAVYLSFPNFVRSGILDNVAGYGWGASWIDTNVDGVFNVGEDENTLNTADRSSGIIFNCVDDKPGTCANSNYGLNISPVGDISGFAWSSSYGWLKFGDLSGFPIATLANGTVSANAKLDLISGKITGWARFCSPSANPSICSGVTVPNTANGGWDGWVSLSGKSSNDVSYGVTRSGTTLTGNAWGGDDNGKNVVGWINFSKVSYTTLTQAVQISANGQAGTTSTDPVIVASGAPINLAWNTVNMTSCTASGNDSTNWSGTKAVPSGIQPTFSITNSNTSPIIKTYTLTCNPGSVADTVYVSIAPAMVPKLVLTADTITVYPPSYQTTLRWTSNISLTGCVADGTEGNLATVPSWNGSVLPPATPALSKLVDVPYNPTRYGLSCLLPDGVTLHAAPVFVSRGNLPESVALSSTAVTSSGTTTLSWTTVNVKSGSCRPFSSPAVASWNAPDPKVDNGFQTSVLVPPSPPPFTTYTLTCTGLYSGNSIPVSLQLNQNSGAASSKKSPRFIER